MIARDTSYLAVMARKNQIMKSSLGIDFDDYIQSPIAFDYERMMHETGYSLGGYHPHPARDQATHPSSSRT